MAPTYSGWLKRLKDCAWIFKPRRSWNGMNFDIVASVLTTLGYVRTPAPPPRLPSTGVVMVVPMAGGAKAAGLKAMPEGTFFVGSPITLIRAPTLKVPV